MFHFLSGIFLMLLLSAAPVRAAAAAESTAATLANLQEAHSSEVNSHLRYLAFAERAELEGHPEAAALFRAAALAEGIHRDNLARVIRGLGAEPFTHPATPVVRGTLENLRNAAEDERYEQETMYPEYLAVARDAGLEEVIRFLTFVAQVEQGHGTLFAGMIARLEAETPGADAFRVCSGCGFTEEEGAVTLCPFCGRSAADFLEEESTAHRRHNTVIEE